MCSQYSYMFCSPTRSSLQSGRLPVHVNVLNLQPTTWNPQDPVSGFAAIPRNSKYGPCRPPVTGPPTSLALTPLLSVVLSVPACCRLPAYYLVTGIASKLKQAGYSTHQVGKWDAGMATVDHTPHGRGYDTSLGYFCHANDYWNEQVGPLVDMYSETEHTTWAGPAPNYLPTDGPAYGMNGSCPGTVSPIGDTGGFCPGMSGPEEDYEEEKFKVRNLAIISGHNVSDAAHPLFLCES